MRIAFLIILSLLMGCQKRNQENAQVTTVEMGAVNLRVSLSGELKANRSTSVMMPYSGYVRKVYVKVGDQVKAGDPLVAFSQSLGSSEQLFPVRASYPGVITQVFRSEGDYLSETEKDKLILRLDDMSKVFVAIDVPEAEMGRLKEGMKAKIRVNALADETWEGSLAYLFRASRERDNSWDRSGGVFPLRIEIINPSTQMMPGLSTVVDVIAKEIPETLRLRQEFLQKDEEGTFLWIDGRKRRVKIGLRTDEYVQILDGAKAGEKVGFSAPGEEKSQP
ncbi:MAG: efflux RND transporter periplasmic adaptor subunit [Bdellovibrionaceae bacterium]|nr:efflux RND transporter periplasmic adaptor subunit [Pseudobdellovibrionaceae bacterium]